MYDPRYLHGLRLFDAEEFFACHDVLEDLWNDTLGVDRQFYQGLIQSAVALFHFGEGNLGGARKLALSACRYLDPYRPQHLGLDVQTFLEQMIACFEELLGQHDGYPAHLTLDPQRIPKVGPLFEGELPSDLS